MEREVHSVIYYNTKKYNEAITEFRGGFCRGEEMPHATQTQATVFAPRLPEPM